MGVRESFSPFPRRGEGPGGEGEEKKEREKERKEKIVLKRKIT